MDIRSVTSPKAGIVLYSSLYTGAVKTPRQCLAQNRCFVRAVPVLFHPVPIPDVQMVRCLPFWTLGSSIKTTLITGLRKPAWHSCVNHLETTCRRASCVPGGSRPCPSSLATQPLLGTVSSQPPPPAKPFLCPVLSLAAN